MTRVIVTPPADADVAAIITWLDAEAGHKIADRYVASFERLYDSLTSHPGIGAPRPELGANIRIGVVPPYIVIYRHTKRDDTAYILRIIHGHRKITGKLLGERR